MTDSATEQAPLDVPVPPERNPMRDPRNRLKLAVFCANVARGTSMSEAETLPEGHVGGVPSGSRWPPTAPGSTG